MGESHYEKRHDDMLLRYISFDVGNLEIDAEDSYFRIRFP